MARLFSTPSRQDAQLVIAAGLLLYFGPKTVRWLAGLLRGSSQPSRHHALERDALPTGTAASDMESRFLAAAEHVSASDLDLDSEQKLELYALFKQAKAGPCRGRAPSIANVVGRAKWFGRGSPVGVPRTRSPLTGKARRDAWSRLGDMSREEAMEAYIARVSALCPELGSVSGGQKQGAAEAPARPRRKAKQSMGPGVSRIQRDDSDVVEWADHEQAFALASAGQEDQLLLLLRTMPDVHKTDGQGRTLLHWAADSGLTRVAETLLERGVEVDMQAHDGMRALHCAVLCEQGEVAELLVRYGAEVTPDIRHEASPSIRPRLSPSATSGADEHKSSAAALPQRPGPEPLLAEGRPRKVSSDSSDAESLPADIEDFADVDAADEEAREAAEEGKGVEEEIEEKEEKEKEKQREKEEKDEGAGAGGSVGGEVFQRAPSAETAKEEEEEEEEGTGRGAVDEGAGASVGVEFSQRDLGVDAETEAEVRGGDGIVEGSDARAGNYAVEDGAGAGDHRPLGKGAVGHGAAGEGGEGWRAAAGTAVRTAMRTGPAVWHDATEKQPHGVPDPTHPVDRAPTRPDAPAPAATGNAAPQGASAGTAHPPASPPPTPREARRISFPGLASPPDRGHGAAKWHRRGGGVPDRAGGGQQRRKASTAVGKSNGGRAKAPASSPLGAPARPSPESPTYREVVKGQASPVMSPALTPAAAPQDAHSWGTQSGAADRTRPAHRGRKAGAGRADGGGGEGTQPDGGRRRRRRGRYRRRDRGGEDA